MSGLLESEVDALRSAFSAIVHDAGGTTTTTEADAEHAFTVRHCTTWCEGAGVDLSYVPAMVAELEGDGPDSTLSWPTIARCVGARYTDGIEYR